jgi:hypothetical protein
METFEINEYYIINCRLKNANYGKIYTCQVVGLDDTHISIIDAVGDKIIIPRINIDGECKVITKEKFESEQDKIRTKRKPKEDEYKSYYQP